MAEITQTPKPTINNDWIVPVDLNGQQVKRNEVTVERAFGGLNTMVTAPDAEGKSTVTGATVSYWYRELYPNNNVIKVELKTYTLEDLAETINEDEHWRQNALAVLTGFINTLGYAGIINPARDTLLNAVVLKLDAVNNYPLHRDTRSKITIE